MLRRLALTRLFATTALFLSSHLAQATSAPDGLWLTRDKDRVIAISSCEDRLCARIAGVFLDHQNDPMLLDYRGLSQCDLPLISDARQVGPNLWKGHILDPRNGSIFGVELHLDPHSNLALRGYLGIPLLGQTETWTRYPGQVPADCRISPIVPNQGNPDLAEQALTGTMIPHR